MEEQEKKIIYLVSNTADQMSEDYLTKKRMLDSESEEEVIDNLTPEELFESLIKKYTRENRGITLGQDFSSLEELGFFLNKETRERGGYEISCYLKSLALRNELKKLFGIDLQMSKTLVSMKPGDILFTITVSNLSKDCPLHDYKEEFLPTGSKLKIKKWWIK